MTNISITISRGSELQTQVEFDFATKLPHPQLKCLLSVIQGLMRFLPSEHMSASQALDALNEQDESK